MCLNEIPFKANFFFFFVNFLGKNMGIVKPPIFKAQVLGSFKSLFK